jgi:hypothetical protein
MVHRQFGRVDRAVDVASPLFCQRPFERAPRLIAQERAQGLAQFAAAFGGSIDQSSVARAGRVSRVSSRVAQGRATTSSPDSRWVCRLVLWAARSADIAHTTRSSLSRHRKATTSSRRSAAAAKELDKTHPGAVASLREGLQETLTVLRLGVPPTLARTLRSTNPIESMISICRDHSTKDWRDGADGAVLVRRMAWSKPASSSAA